MQQRLVYLPEQDLLITEKEWYRKAQALMYRERVVAQMVEQEALDLWGTGSSPVCPSKELMKCNHSFNDSFICKKCGIGLQQAWSDIISSVSGKQEVNDGT